MSPKQIHDPRDDIQLLKQRVEWLEAQLLTMLHGSQLGDAVEINGFRGHLVGMESGKFLVQLTPTGLTSRIWPADTQACESSETLRLRRLRKLGLAT